MIKCKQICDQQVNFSRYQHSQDLKILVFGWPFWIKKKNAILHVRLSYEPILLIDKL